MDISIDALKKIKTDFARLTAKDIEQNNQKISLKEAIRTLAPTLEKMRGQGFGIPEICHRLEEASVVIRPGTLAKYLSEFRSEKAKRKDCRTKNFVVVDGTNAEQAEVSAENKGVTSNAAPASLENDNSENKTAAVFSAPPSFNRNDQFHRKKNKNGKRR